jgi:hypothetical protein
LTGHAPDPVSVARILQTGSEPTGPTVSITDTILDQALWERAREARSRAPKPSERISSHLLRRRCLLPFQQRDRKEGPF